MVLRPGKLLLIALIPVALYGGLKGAMYFKAKTAMDDIVLATSNQADIRYAGIDTEVLGGITVRGITVQPRGLAETIGIDAVRLGSDDPLFFVRSWDVGPGKADEPPDHLSLQVSGLRMPLDSALFEQYALAAEAATADRPCANGPSLEPALLRQLGFTELTVDFGGHYRLDKTTLSLDAGWRMEVQDLQSIDMSVEMSDVDTQTLSQGAPPQMNLAGFRLAVEVSPAFGQQALKSCALGTDLTVDEWSERYAEQFIAGLAAEGLSLGSGLQRAVRDFYREWGTIEVVAAPAEPVGLLSLAFLPPNRLADALSLRLIVNDKLVTDTRFTWERDSGPALSALFGAEPEEAATVSKAKPRRIIVRRDFETVPAAELASYLDHTVRIKPRGQPLREGLLKRIANNEAEVEQTLHGGKFTVYVPLSQIDSVEALVQRQVNSLP